MKYFMKFHRISPHFTALKSTTDCARRSCAFHRQEMTKPGGGRPGRGGLLFIETRRAVSYPLPDRQVARALRIARLGIGCHLTRRARLPASANVFSSNRRG